MSIIALHLCYTWTDSPMLIEITNQLPALKQQAKYMLTAMLIKMVVPIIMDEVMQLLLSASAIRQSGNPLELLKPFMLVSNCPP